MDITERAERLVTASDPEAFAQVLVLARRLQTFLQQQAALDIWLELEEALHAFWVEMSAAHYDLGAERDASRHAIGNASGSERSGKPTDYAADEGRIGSSEGASCGGTARGREPGNPVVGRRQREELAALLRELADALDDDCSG